MIWLLIMLIFAVIAVWPRWAAPYATWRLTAFGVSWLAFTISLAAPHLFGAGDAVNVWLLVQLIFAAIAVWPVWTPVYATWRMMAFAISWLFFAIYLVSSHGGFAKALSGS